MTDPTESQDPKENGTGGAADASPSSAAASPQQEMPRAIPSDESTGNAALDARLAQGVVDFSQGIDKAQVWISAFLVVVLGTVASLALFQVPYHGLARTLLLNDDQLHRVSTAANHLDVAPESPLAVLSYGLIFQLFNGAVIGFHIVNLILHLLAGVLSYLVVRQLLKGRASEAVAMAGGMLFAVHPLVAASLGIITGQSGMLACGFLLLGVWIHLRSTALDRPAGPVAIALALVAFALAYASHAVAIAFPLLLLGADAVRGGVRRNAAAHLATFGLAATLVAVRFGAGLGNTDSGGLVAVLKAQSEFASFGLRRVFWPVNVLPVPGPARGTWDVAGAAAIVMFGYAGVVLCVKRSPLGLPLIWFSAISLAAPCLLRPEDLLSPQAAYLLLPVPAMLLPWILTRFPVPAPRAAAGLAAAVLVLAGAWWNYRELLRYTIPVDLWRSVAGETESAAPQRYLAWELLAMAPAAPTPEVAAAVLDQSAKSWQAVLHLDPDDLEAKRTLGKLLDALGRGDEAVPVWEDIIQRRPDDVEATLQLASHYARNLDTATGAEKLQETLDWLRRAEQLGPLPPELNGRFGALLAGMGNFREAATRLRQAYGADHPMVKQVEEHTATISALERQSMDLIQQGKVNDGLIRRAEMFAVQNRLDAALYLATRVLKDAPSNATAWALAGYLEGALGNADRFVADHAAQAPADVTAWRELAKRTAAGGFWDAAEIYLQQGAGGWTEGASPTAELARIALELQRPAKAAEVLERAAAGQAETYPLELLWVEVDVARNDAASARRHLDKAVELGAPADAVIALQDRIAALEAGQAPVRTKIE